jgi:Ca2+/Na+ antiporter
MPPFNNFLPVAPYPLLEIIIYTVAGLGAILIAYAVFLKAEKRQDVLLLIGSLCLVVYSLWIGNLIFLVAMLGLFLSSLVEWLEILFGFHQDLGAKTKPEIKTENPKII